MLVGWRCEEGPAHPVVIGSQLQPAHLSGCPADSTSKHVMVFRPWCPLLLSVAISCPLWVPCSSFTEVSHGFWPSEFCELLPAFGHLQGSVQGRESQHSVCVIVSSNSLRKCSFLHLWFCSDVTQPIETFNFVISLLDLSLLSIVEPYIGYIEYVGREGWLISDKEKLL